MATLSAPADLVAEWLRPFAPLFTRPTWHRVLMLVTGALLAPQRRTVTAALRAAGLEQAVHFARYHAVLNRACWSALAVSRVLLARLVAAFASTGPVVIGLDDTIERRWGGRIKARGIYRDPVRSSHGHFVKTSGLRWLSAMLLVPVPWAGLGLAIAHRPLSLRALCCRAWHPPQEAHRLGQADAAPARPLAA